MLTAGLRNPDDNDAGGDDFFGFLGRGVLF